MSGPRDEALAGGTAQGSKGLTTTDLGILPDTDAQRKAAATAIARAALAGVAVHTLADGRFLAVLGVGHVLPDLDALQAFLGRLEGAS